MLSRSDILARFLAQIAAGTPVIGGGAGTGISAKCAEMGGIDLIIHGVAWLTYAWLPAAKTA